MGDQLTQWGRCRFLDKHVWTSKTTAKGLPAWRCACCDKIELIDQTITINMGASVKLEKSRNDVTYTGEYYRLYLDGDIADGWLREIEDSDNKIDLDCLDHAKEVQAMAERAVAFYEAKAKRVAEARKQGDDDDLGTRLHRALNDYLCLERAKGYGPQWGMFGTYHITKPITLPENVVQLLREHKVLP